MVFISSKKLFLFLGYWIFCQFFQNLSNFQIQRVRQKKRNFSKNVLQLKERLVTSSTPFLFFMSLSINGGLFAKEKMKLTFSWSPLKYLLYSFFWNFQKSIACIGCFGLFTKIKRVMGLAFSADFLHTFSVKMFLFKYHIKWPNCTIWGMWAQGLKGTLRSGTIFVKLDSFKMMKNVFFISPSKLFSFSQYLNFYLDFLFMYENFLIRKIRLILNFLMSQPG